MSRKININGISSYWSKFCQVCGRVDGNRVSHHAKSGMTLCEKHKNQYNRHGSFMEQSKFENNKVEFKGDECWLGLNNFKGGISDWCVIDSDDYDKIKDYKWFKRNDGRVVANVTSLNIGVSHLRIHNIIMNFNEDLKYEYEVDHIDCNTLNNKKSNLRIVTKSKNGMNRGLQSNNLTGVCGVVSIKHNNQSPWMPQIKINRKMIRLGTEYSFDEAVKKRLIAEAELFKEHSNNYNFDTQTLQLTYTSLDDKLQTYIECDLQGQILQFTKLQN